MNKEVYMEQKRDRTIAVRTVLGEQGVNHSIRYGKVTFVDDGYLEIYGDVELTIDTVANQKDSRISPYEFLAVGNAGSDGADGTDGPDGPDGRQGGDGTPTNVKIHIGMLEDSICAACIGGDGGRGGHGLDGLDGGDGGDAQMCTGGGTVPENSPDNTCDIQEPLHVKYAGGGRGGDGGCGRGTGGDGGHGGDGPRVLLTYEKLAGDAVIRTVLMRSRGGDGGTGGRGGRGGISGRDSDGKKRQKDGRPGSGCQNGRNGQPGQPGSIRVQRTDTESTGENTDGIIGI